MLRFIALVFVLIALSSCASKPLYSPAPDSESLGYYETRLTESRYRVTFNGAVYTPEEKVKNYALLRAAELTVNNGYDWFQIVDRDGQDSRPVRSPRVDVRVGVGRGPVPRCYPYGCWVVNGPAYTGVDFRAIELDDRRQSIIEIVMGKGEPDEPTSVYNAHELLKYLGAELLPKPTRD